MAKGATRAAAGETRLYEPVKKYWIERGYAVRGEVDGCDLVARRGDELVVVELKAGMNLTLVLQGLDRKAITDQVYLAVPAAASRRRSYWSKVIRLCRALGLGLLLVSVGRGGRGRVDVACEPGAPAPRKSARRRADVLAEFEGRSGDYNVGGSTRRPLVTAYREDALRIARCLAIHGPSRVRSLREASGCPRAGAILQRNYYGWFHRVAHGVYDLTGAGREALVTYRDVVEALEPLAPLEPSGSPGSPDPSAEAISSSSRSTPASTSS